MGSEHLRVSEDSLYRKLNLSHYGTEEQRFEYFK